jgi:hypothetical protein
MCVRSKNEVGPMSSVTSCKAKKTTKRGPPFEMEGLDEQFAFGFRDE